MAPRTRLERRDPAGRLFAPSIFTSASRRSSRRFIPSAGIDSVPQCHSVQSEYRRQPGVKLSPSARIPACAACKLIYTGRRRRSEKRRLGLAAMNNSARNRPIQPPAIFAVPANALVAGRQDILRFFAEFSKPIIPRFNIDFFIDTNICDMPSRGLDSIAVQLADFAKPDRWARRVVESE